MADDLGQVTTLTRRRVIVRGSWLLLGMGTVAAALPTVSRQARAQATRSNRSTRLVVPPAIIIGEGTVGLPPAVVEMRAEIASAVERGEIAELKRAMDLNELKPEVGAPAGVDPIDYLRQVSADGNGASVLLHLGRLLEGKWASIPGGRDIENNRMFVWPHFAEIDIAKLEAADREDLAKLVGEAAASTILADGKWRGWRLTIGADGVWHTYMDIGR